MGGNVNVSSHSRTSLLVTAVACRSGITTATERRRSTEQNTPNQNSPGPKRPRTKTPPAYKICMTGKLPCIFFVLRPVSCTFITVMLLTFILIIIISIPSPLTLSFQA